MRSAKRRSTGGTAQGHGGGQPSQQAAFDALASSSDKLNTSTRAATAGWQESARAQSASMNAYHNAGVPGSSRSRPSSERRPPPSAGFDKQQSEL
ncbi:hypothetical protein P4052_06820, partial [Pseudomonas aeruginosa]|nr:hypothetical protein [Pseudomonas aeruginosa]